MRTSCLINNYNYATFLPEAINSVINQTSKFDEIIIVDDASSDRSASIIQEFAAQNDSIKYLISDRNQGQLNAFNQGFQAATGDIIFFLDSDDAYKPEYLEQSLKFYRAYQLCDFLFCAYEKFGAQEEICRKYQLNVDLGYSAIKTQCLHSWIGSITSTLSIRRKILQKFLPIPFTDDWRVRADDCLIWGSSLVGARKMYLAEPLVRYRIHGTNHFQNDQSLDKHLNIDANFEYQRSLIRSRLFNYIKSTNYIDLPVFLAYAALNEFKTIPAPNTQELIQYLKIIFTLERSIYWKIKGIVLLFMYFLQISKKMK